MLRKLAEMLIDVILPQKKRVALARDIKLEDVPLSPAVWDFRGVKIVSLMEYRDPTIEALIQALKYDRSSHAAKMLALILEDYLRSEREDAVFGAPMQILVPIPLHASRKRERGFNQIELVLELLPKEFTVDTNLLTRVRATPPQTKLSRAERLKNVSGAFAFTGGARTPSGVRAIVIDDVTTTGATLYEATAALKSAGFDVEALALARA